MHSLPGHRWAQSRNRCPGCRLLEIFTTENSRIQSKTLSNLLIPAWNTKVYEQGESLGCFSHTSPDTEMSCKESCTAWFLPGAGSASSWEANAEANAGMVCGSWRASAASTIPSVPHQHFLHRGVFSCLFHAQELQSFKNPKDSICFPRSRRSRQVIGKSQPWCKAPGDTWHLLNILSHNIFI